MVSRECRPHSHPDLLPGLGFLGGKLHCYGVMRADLKESRQEIYRAKAHPQVAADFLDKRDSFLTVYLTLAPFLAAEYFAEISYDFLPSGMVFPVGYLLFWAFYYTYYKPGLLEDRLSDPHKWDFAGLPALFVGVLIWFVKISLVELSHLFVFRWLIPGAHRAKVAPGAKGPKSATPNHAGAHKPHPGFEQKAKAAPKPGPSRPASPPPNRPQAPPPPSALPREILTALKTLGLTDKANWDQIHRRYRELAKKYHPDLNRERTEAGRHFIVIDSAYRRLASAKSDYFSAR